MKKVYFIVILLFVVGMMGSFYLMPNDDEVSLIVYKEQIDDRYGEVEANYRGRLEAGEITAEVVSPLVKMYLEAPDIDKAIEVLEIFVEHHPDDIDSRMELGKLYQYAQRPDDYLRNLEVINNYKTNSEVLKALSDIYSFNGEYEKQAEVLAKLLETKEKLEPYQVVDLASLLAAHGKTDEAIVTLRKLRETSPESTPFEAVELLASLLLDVDKADEAYNESFSWHEAGGKPEEVARLVNILHFKGAPNEAQKLIDLYGDEVYKVTDLLYEQILLYLTFGKDDDAFAVLSRLYNEDSLPEEMVDSYLILALKRNENTLVTELSDRITEENIDEIQAITLVEVAVGTKRRKLLNTINSKLGGELYREAHPLFDIVLGLARRESGIDARINKYVGVNEVTDAQRLVVARNCAKAGKYKCADRFLKIFTEGDVISNQKIAAAGSLYTDMKRYKRGYEFVNEHRKVNSSLDVERVWVRLAASQGQDEAVTNWMEAHPDELQSNLLTDIYFLSSDNRHYDMAAKVAEIMYDRTPSADTRSYLANAYIKTGLFSQALALLEQNSEMSQDDADNYLAALVTQASRNPSYRGELGRFASTQLKKPMSDKRRLGLIYALIDGGRLDVAMPYIRQYAMKRGGNWVYIYAENLEKQGKYSEARDFWVMLAGQKGTSVKEKRNIAYSLIEKGFFDDAANIFGELAENAGPDSEEVSQLLYLWGPRLNESQASWLYSRSQSAATAEDSQKWLRLAGDYGSSETLVKTLQANPSLRNNEQLFPSYLQSLYDLRMYDELNALQSENLSPVLLEQYAKFSLDNGMGEVAESSFKKLHDLLPDAQGPLREVGILSYSEADYSDAKTYLANYLIKHRENPVDDKDAYLVYYHYAELLRQERDDEANTYYQATVDLVDASNVRTSDMESKKAQSLIFLGAENEGFEYFDQARSRFPQDTVLHADMMGALIEAKRYNEAENMLAESNGSSLKVESTPLHLDDNQGFTAYRVLKNRRELLLATNPREIKTEEFIKHLPLSHQWVSYATKGYDKTLIVAKPDWQLEVVQGADGGVTVVPTRDDRVAARGLDKQMRLRRELMQARIEVETERQYVAAERLNALSEDYGDDLQYLGYMANVENFNGAWPRALKLLRKAEAISPENEDIAELKQSIERLHAQHIKIDHEWRQLGDHEENITTLEGFATVSDGWDVGVVLQNDDVNAATLRRANGTINSYESRRQRGELFVRNTNDDGDEIKASIYANNETMGAGVGYGFINWLGRTNVRAEWHRPYWEFVEGVLDDATRDRISVDHMHRLNNKITLSGGVGVNNYNVDGIDNVASSVSVDANASYQLDGKFAEKENLAVIYGLDAEYEIDHKERRDGSNNLYRPFPFRSREVHSLSLAGKHDFSKTTNLEWLGGYAFDRLGGHGPLAEARLTHEITDSLEFQARASIGVGAGETEDDLTRVGAYLLYRY